MPEPEINGAFQVAPRGGNSEGEQRAQPVPAAPGGQRGPQGAGGSRQWRVAVCPCRPPPAASGVCAPVVTRVPSARSIDCAGVLKLRNSDIELRKGETDIGRKNTRVRLVFRVHIPQPDGRTLSLQVASNPIECCECPRQAGRPRAGACPSQARPSFLLVCVSPAGCAAGHTRIPVQSRAQRLPLGSATCDPLAWRPLSPAFPCDPDAPASGRTPLLPQGLGGRRLGSASSCDDFAHFC